MRHIFWGRSYDKEFSPGKYYVGVDGSVTLSKGWVGLGLSLSVTTSYLHFSFEVGPLSSRTTVWWE